MPEGPPLTEQQIEDGITKWHTKPFDDRELHESLGLTWNQFAAWVECKPGWWEFE